MNTSRKVRGYDKGQIFLQPNLGGNHLTKSGKKKWIGAMGIHILYADANLSLSCLIWKWMQVTNIVSTIQTKTQTTQVIPIADLWADPHCNDNLGLFCWQIFTPKYVTLYRFCMLRMDFV